MWVTSSLTSALTPTAVALGNFDGVHRGHRQVIQPVLNFCAASKAVVLAAQAGEVNTEGSELSETKPELSLVEVGDRVYPTVVTFNPHPQEFFTGQPRALLTPPEEKVLQLQNMGVEQLVLLPFDRELADLSPQQFVEEILVRRLQARCISVGIDFRFGKGRIGTAADLQAIAATYGIEVTTVVLQTCESERISSSNVRKALQEGDLQLANRLLGRAYTLVGQVVTGQQLGRTIGFPTANLKLVAEKFLPRQGVYAVRVYGPTLASAQSPLSGVMNIGYRPTVDGTQQTVEIHLLDWGGDLYGQTLTVSLEHFLRPEQRFAALDELKAQIKTDCAAAQALLFPASSL